MMPLRSGLAGLLLTEQPPSPRLARLPNYRWFVVGTVCIGAFLGQLDASIATLVLPTLEEVFHSSVAAVEWVAIAYLLTLAALVVTFGRLADMTGRKLMYNAGFIIFILGSGLCGLAPGLGLLIGFRVLQAVGAAMLQANSVAIITAAVPRSELGRAIGVQGAAQAVGLSVGPSVGGFLIGALGWQWVFYIAVPFGIAGTVAAWFVLPLTARPSAIQGSGLRTQDSRERFDFWGAGLFAVAVAFGLLALTFGNDWGWSSPRLIGSLVVAAAAFAAFLIVEMRVTYPLIDFGLFRSAAFSGGVSAALLAFGVLFGVLFIIPFYMQRILEYDPAKTGLLLTSVPVMIAILAPISGTLSDKIGPRVPRMIGMGLAAAALLLLMFFERAPIGIVLLVLALFGTGAGAFIPPNNSAIMGSAPPNRLGIAGGVLNMTRSLGTSLGVAATGAVLALGISGVVGHAVQGTIDVPLPALLAGFRDALLFLAVMAIAASLISAIEGKRTARSPELEAESIGI